MPCFPWPCFRTDLAFMKTTGKCTWGLYNSIWDTKLYFKLDTCWWHVEPAGMHLFRPLTLTMTLIFELLIWSLCAAHCLIEVDMCAKLFENPLYPWLSYSLDNLIFDLWPLSVTLTFALQVMFLRMTHRLIEVDNFVKLFVNPSIHGEVTAFTKSDERTDGLTHIHRTAIWTT